MYFFFNEGAQPISHTVTIAAGIPGGYSGVFTGPGPINLAAPMVVESWDPSTGTASPIPYKQAKLAFTIKLDLKPYETKLITIK